MHYEYYQEYYNVPTHEQRPMWKVGDAWRARGGKPHIIITATFGVNPRETKERILRGEVLAILAAIRTRLFRSDMREHLVIPVMLVSTIADCSRILLAHFDGTNLLVRKSWTWNFVTDDPNVYERVMVYMASEPIGDTKSTPASAATSEEADFVGNCEDMLHIFT
ncbi:uncharacterized protein PFLUO_LOCUS5578 [Penicillium psychrofluorescens]|uniref:uncharacterized protein n=1 Tax=Penicillium psychrofluorescens TaxID=3158075 RepID=UPI003CCC9FA2